MKPLPEQDHYEILEVARDARPEQIERSYKLALATYADDSLAGYSVFGDGDAEHLRARVETAYRVLADPGTRRAYDTTLGGGGTEASPSEPSAGMAPEDAPVETVSTLEPAHRVEEFDEIDDLEEQSGEFDGARLRRARMRRGIDIEEISRVTRINPNFLGFLEDERFDALPAAVYVRGFVSAYATYVGLDPARVASSYMQRFEHERPVGRNGRQQPAR